MDLSREGKTRLRQSGKTNLWQKENWHDRKCETHYNIVAILYVPYKYKILLARTVLLQ